MFAIVAAVLLLMVLLLLRLLRPLQLTAAVFPTMSRLLLLFFLPLSIKTASAAVRLLLHF